MKKNNPIDFNDYFRPPSCAGSWSPSWGDAEIPDTAVPKWDSRFIQLAKFVSTWSKDPSTQVGAVIVDKNNRIVSVGYNGFPSNIVDDDRLNDREFKIKHITHAEENALISSGKTCLSGCAIYTYPFQPCQHCAKMIRNFGISKVVSLSSNIQRWEESFKNAREIFQEAGIKLHLFQTE